VIKVFSLLPELYFFERELSIVNLSAIDSQEEDSTFLTKYMKSLITLPKIKPLVIPFIDFFNMNISLSIIHLV